MIPAVIHRVSALELGFRRWDWPFAQARRAEIDAHFEITKRAMPGIWNGRVLLARNPVFAAGRLAADYFETDFASLLAWRDWGFREEEGAINGFGMGALRCSDGAFVLGEMGGHTTNAGRIYFPAGTPDLDDIVGDTVDIAGSVARELEEETGLAPADYRAADSWDCVVVGTTIAMIRILDCDLPGEAMRARIEANLAAQAEPELAAIHLVRHRRDLTAAMPRFVTAFFEHHWAD
jgi:8-oxo-dGTP pyrophosphatase MutT (NUDIX family)